MVALPAYFGVKHVQAKISSWSELAADYRGESINLIHPSGSERCLIPVIKAFSDITKTKINLVSTPVDSINGYLNLGHYSGRDIGDLALPATFGIPDLARAGVLKDLQEYRAKYSSKIFEDGLLYSAGGEYLDKFYGYQTDGDTYLIYINPVFFENNEAKGYEDKFGVELRSPKTWQELDNQIRFFHKPKKDLFGGLLFRNSNYVVWEWWLRFHAQGGLPFSSDANPLVDSEQGVSALEELISVSDYLHPKAFSNGLFENWEMYAKGNVYCNIGWGGTQKYLKKNSHNLPKGTLAACPPGDANLGKINRVGYFNWGWNYSVPVSGKNPELSFLFSMFATSKEFSNLAIKGDGFFDPFRLSHYEDDEVKSLYGSQFLNEHKYCMENSIPDFYITRRGEYFDSLRQGILDALYKKKTAKKALSHVANQWKVINHKNGYGLVQNQWESIRKKYPKTFEASI